MRKYKIARLLAWVIIAAGAALTGLMLFLLIYGSLSTSPFLGGTIMNLQLLPFILLGIGAALSGFVCHAIFDATEAYLKSIDRGD